MIVNTATVLSSQTKSQTGSASYQLLSGNPSSITNPAVPNQTDDGAFVPIPRDTPVNETIDDSTTGEGAAQVIQNWDYAFRMPIQENEAQYQRAQVSLIDEQFAQFMSGLSLAPIERVLTNELANIDRNIYRLQIAWLNTMLTSPISGHVTGIYKNVGDMVRAGETVIRVEDTTNVLLVAHIIYPDGINFTGVGGVQAEITTQLFDTSGTPTTIPGQVVAARGLGHDDSWEIVVQCSNGSVWDPILPLGYHFDYENTTLAIT